MITTDVANYELRKEKFLAYKDTLEKVPTDPDAKKEYYVGCHSAEDWQYIHEVLMQDGTLEDNIPDHCCECCNDCKYAPRRGIYLLSDSEAEELKNHSRVRYVNINAARYPGTFADNPDDVAAATKIYRYPSTVKHQRYLTTYGLVPSSPGIDLKNRAGWQLRRHQQQTNPSFGSLSEPIDDRIQQYGDGSDVDIIVCDEDMWFGHIEFQNNLGGPIGYRGGNVLPGNGTCDLLDLLLDSPYYIDPDFFNANPSKLMRRWDGTVVPTEEGAYNWWKNNSTSHRSAKFVSTSNGGTATGDNDFGSVTYNPDYTRANSNGSNTSYQTGYGNHGTPCASQAYGRQYGWAYNANKWFLNMYGTNNNGPELGFAVQRIFHQIKPINPSYGTKDPTISSNSWGHRWPPPDEGYYWFRPSAIDGTVAGIAYTSGTKPKFLSQFYNYGHAAITYETDNSVIEAGEELCDSGVIFVLAAGNQNQKQVHSNHPDYNNYYASSNYTALEDATSTSPYSSMSSYQYYHAVNRRGYPGQIGIVTSTTPYTYKTISVGVIDRTLGTGGERRAPYSNCGEDVDVFAAGDGSLAAADRTYYNRYDNTYTLDGEQSVESDDQYFDGTSSACPIFVGLLATKMQYNRSWDYSDVKSWIVGLGTMPSSEFIYGTEATTADDSTNWGPFSYSMQGNPGYVVWDKPTGNEPNNAFLQSVDDTTPTEGDTVEITITTNASNGTYYYTTDVGAGSTISASDFDSNSLTGSFNIVSGIGTISLGITTDSTEELIKESFRIRVRTGTGIGDTVLATSEYITITDSDAPTVTFTTTPTSIDEGSTGTFEISASSFSDGTNLYWDVTRPSEFDTSSGTVTVSSGVGTISVTPTNDYTTEGSQTFNLRIRPEISGQVLATSNDVTINDTSIDIIWFWQRYPTSIGINSTQTYTLKAINGEGKSIYIGKVSHYTNPNPDVTVNVPSPYSPLSSTGIATVTVTGNTIFDEDDYVYLSVRESVGSLTRYDNGDYIKVVSSTTPIYVIIPANNSVNEGSSLTIDVETVNVGSGTTLYWDVTNSNDFSTSNGSFTISNNAGSFSVTPSSDNFNEGSETFKISLYTDSARTIGVQTSQTLTINNVGGSSYYWIDPASSSVDEGSSLTFDVTTINVASGTTAYWDVTNPGDFDISSGSFTVLNNAGSFSVTPTADRTTEGSETFTATIYTDSARTISKATSSSITINDTSVDTIEINPEFSSIDEGGTVTFNVINTDVSEGATLYWDVTNPGEFSASNGSFTISNGVGSFNVTATADSTTEGSETFTATVYTDSARTIGITTSDSITINDASENPVISLDNIKFMSGSGLTFSGSVRIVMK